MKKGIVISAVVGLASGVTLGILSNTKKASQLRKKLFKNINSRFFQLERKLRNMLSMEAKNAMKNEQKLDK